MSQGAEAMATIERMLESLSEVPSRAAREASEEIESLIVEQFARGEDPYGEPWEELAESTRRRGRTNPPLTDTHDMVDGLEVKPTAGAGIAVTLDQPYSRFHQTGTKRMPARPILPTGELPEAWETAIAGAVVNAAARATGAR